jgi:hypothetical protein
LRLRTAFVVWGLLAIAGWLLLLLPAYVVVDQGPAVMQALFGDDRPPATSIAKPDDDRVLTPAEIEALGKIAPAAGGKATGGKD